MANSQREDGHIDVANEIAEKFIKYRLPGQEWQILWLVFRKTWGWTLKGKDGKYLKDENGWIRKKEEDWITYGQMSDETDIPRQKCKTLADSLVNKRVLLRRVTQKGDTKQIWYRFQKDFDKWKLSPKKVTVPQKGDKSVPQKGDHKRKKERKIERGRKKPAPPVHAFFRYWDEKFMENTGSRYTFNGGKEGQIVKRLLATDNPEDLTTLVNAFFSLEDEFLEKAGKTIGVFASQVNKLKSYKAKEPKREFF